MKVLLEFPTHHYIEEFKKTEQFCLHCGKQGGLWKSAPQYSDYYAGPTFYCTICNRQFNVSLEPHEVKSSPSVRVVEQLRVGRCFEPSTRPGR